jgi:glycosyltransferase involved in cell wall biosynthesis
MARRIFWLGMHKILVQTELPRLRMLGYEVFNPRYISPIAHPSAELSWDVGQQTTLPQDVFERLASYDFFYNQIDPGIAELLNTYFETVIVTIHPHWLAEFLKVYRGRLIYRVYGQGWNLSQELTDRGALPKIVERDNFWFVPHASETVTGEHAWLKERMTVVPYCLPNDIMRHANTWSGSGLAGEIALTCPNITNPFFKAHFDFLQKEFGAAYYRYFGAQLQPTDNPNIVGTLGREELIERFKRCNGHLYTYSLPNSCYLPPIEMMMLGGPVLFMPGSLLDRMSAVDAPGRCVSIEDAHRKAQRLLDGDREFAAEIVASQPCVRERYEPAKVWPIFDVAMRQILESSNQAPNWLEPATVPSEQRTMKRIYALHHFDGQSVIFLNGEYAARDGIPLVVRQILEALASVAGLEVCVTARADQVANFFGYFGRPHLEGRLRIFCIDKESLARDRQGYIDRLPAAQRLLVRASGKMKAIVARIMPEPLLPYARRLLPRNVRRSIRRWRSLSGHVERHIEAINQDPSCVAVLVPHYHAFPEAMQLAKPACLYLPDYMPHLCRAGGQLAGMYHTAVGRALVRKAKALMCHSNFTKEYLPSSALEVPPEKIKVAYLPLLNIAKAATDAEEADLLNSMGVAKPYLFYPTQARANRSMPLLLEVFERLAERGHDARLVLTGSLAPDRRTVAMLTRMKHRNRIHFVGSISDNQLAALYRNAAVLCFTSLGEGNFPPQIQEALWYDLPVVTSRLAFIAERLPPDHSDALILCKPNDIDDFVAGCETALRDREGVLARQRAFRSTLDNAKLTEDFRRAVLEMFGLDAGRQDESAERETAAQVMARAS